MRAKKKIIFLIASGLSSFFIFFLIFISLISMLLVGGGGGKKTAVEDSEMDSLIEIEISGKYVAGKGNLSISGSGIKIKNIKGKGTKTGFTAKTEGKKGKIVRAEYTAFGPPWNSMEGGGKNAVDGSSQDKDLAEGKFVCAAPKSVPFWTKVLVGGTGTEQDGRVYITKDRGGAIVVSGSIYHFDLLMKTRTEQNSFGRRNGNAMIGGNGNADLHVKIDKKSKVIITGNANGTEVFAEGFYKNGKISAKGWLGSGATDGGQVANGHGTEDMVKWAIKIAKGKNKHGYSQANRTCCFCRKGATPDYDCSSFVTAALAHNNMEADFKRACKKTWPYTTFNIAPALKKNGWKKVGNLDISKCKRGDILLNPTSHIEICCGGGINVGAHQNRDGKTGESADNEVYLAKPYRHWWTEVWRFKGKGKNDKENFSCHSYIGKYCSYGSCCLDVFSSGKN